MNKLYLITYNTGENFNKSIFHGYIRSLYNSSCIIDWWHYIDASYIVASSLSVNDLYNAIYPGVPMRNLIIVEIIPSNVQGWLPKEAWTWINKYKN